MSVCIFCKIRDGEIVKEFIYQDDDVMVFADIHPNAKTHLLILPKKHIQEFIVLEDEVLRNKLFDIVQKMIYSTGLKNNRYQIRINGGGLQDIDHLHIHLLGPL